MDGQYDLLALWSFNIPVIFLHLYEAKNFQNVEEEMETRPPIRTITVMKESGWFEVMKG